MENGNISVLTVAQYVINWFNKNQKTITQLKLQKLLYFIEAYYMNINHGKALYYEDFKAYTYGPVSFDVYNEYNHYSGFPIIDVYPEIENNNTICEFKYVIETICKEFGVLTASQLVNLTHEDGSPWYEVYVKQKKPLSVINKNETMKWFKERFMGNA